MNTNTLQHNIQLMCKTRSWTQIQLRCTNGYNFLKRFQRNLRSNHTDPGCCFLDPLKVTWIGSLQSALIISGHSVNHSRNVILLWIQGRTSVGYSERTGHIGSVSVFLKQESTSPKRDSNFNVCSAGGQLLYMCHCKSVSLFWKPNKLIGSEVQTH